MGIKYKSIISFNTIVLRDLYRIIRIWPQTLLPSAISSSLYFLIFGNFMGNKIHLIPNISYKEFIVPGLILMAVISNSYSNVVSVVFSSKFQKNIEELIISPTPNYIILIGFSVGGVSRGLMVGFIVSVITLFFTHIKIYSLLLSLIVITSSSFLFSLAGFMNGLCAKNFDETSIIPTFVIIPLTYLGGVFYSVTNLQYFWKFLTKINPIFYLVNLFRYSFIGYKDDSITIFKSLIIIFLSILILFIINIYLLKKGKGFKN